MLRAYDAATVAVRTLGCSEYALGEIPACASSTSRIRATSIMSIPMATIISDQELKQHGFYWRELDGVKALICAPLEAAGFANGFSTRMGGTSAMPADSLNLAGFNEDSAENILENRRRFLKLFPGTWALAGCWQVHGSDARVVNNLAEAKPAEDARGDSIYCDAIVSNAQGVLAGVKTADCVPILIGDPVNGCFAAVHAGWRGTLAEIGTSTLKRMSENTGRTPPMCAWRLVQRPVPVAMKWATM